MADNLFQTLMNRALGRSNKPSPTDIELPNESGRSDLSEVPQVKSVNGGTQRVPGVEVRPDGATIRLPNDVYKMKDGQKRVIRRDKQ